MNIKEEVKNIQGIIVFVKVKGKSLLLDISENAKIEIDEGKNMMFIDMNPVLYSKIGICLSKLKEIGCADVDDSIDLDNFKFVPDKAYCAFLEDRTVSIFFKLKANIEKLKTEMHKEINSILNPVNKES